MTNDSDSVGSLARLCRALAKSEGPQEPIRPTSQPGEVYCKSPQVNFQRSWCDFAVVFKIDKQEGEWIDKDFLTDLPKNDPMTSLKDALKRLNRDSFRIFKQSNTSNSNPSTSIFLVPKQRSCIVKEVKATVEKVEKAEDKKEVSGKLTFQGLIRFPSNYHHKPDELGPAPPDVGIAIVRLEYEQDKSAQTLDAVLAINLEAREQAKNMVQQLVPDNVTLREPYAYLVVQLSTEFDALFDRVWEDRASKPGEVQPPMPPEVCADINRLLDLQEPAPFGPKDNDDHSREWLAERLHYQTTPGGGGVYIAYDYNSALNLFAGGHREPDVKADDLSLYQLQVMHQLYVRAVAETYSERLSDNAAGSKLEAEFFATMQGQMQSFVNAYDFPFLSSGRNARELYKLARRAMVIETHLLGLHEAVRATAEYHDRRAGIAMAKRSEEMAKRSGSLAMWVAVFALLSLWTGFFGMNTLDESDMRTVVKLFGDGASHKSCLPVGKGPEASQSPALSSSGTGLSYLAPIRIDAVGASAASVSSIATNSSSAPANKDALCAVLDFLAKIWGMSWPNAILLILIGLLTISSGVYGLYLLCRKICTALHSN